MNFQQRNGLVFLSIVKKIENKYLKYFLKGKNSDTPRQKLQKVYKLNGSIYIIKKRIFIKKKMFFDKTMPFIMDKKFSINIDTAEDFKKFKSKILK